MVRILLLFILTFSLSAQVSYELVDHITFDNGLPSNNVYSMIKDHEGFIWMATDKGVVKYDGNSFRVFTVADGLPRNDVFDLKQDRWGRIWVMCKANFMVYIKENKVVRASFEELFYYPRDFFEDSLGVIITTLDHTIFEENDTIISTDLSNRSFRFLYTFSGDDTFSINFPNHPYGKVSHYLPRHRGKINYNFFQVDNKFLGFYDQKENDVWVTDLDSKKTDIISIPPSNPNQSYTYKFKSQDSHFQLVDHNRLYEIDPRELNVTELSLDLSAYCREPTYFLETHNLLFVSSLDQGVFIFRPLDSATTLNMPLENVTDLEKINDTTVAISNIRGAISFVDEHLKVKSKYRQSNFKWDTRIEKMRYVDTLERLYFSSFKTRFGYLNTNSSFQPLSFATTQTDTLQTFMDGYYVNPHRMLGLSGTKIYDYEFFGDTSIYSIPLSTAPHNYDVKNDTFYVGYDGGILSYHIPTSSSTHKKFAQNVLSVLKTKLGFLIGTESEGLLLLNENMEIKDSVLRSISIYEIDETKNSITLATSNGMYNLSKKYPHQIINYISTTDGLWSNEVISTEITENFCWIATEKGVQLFKLDSLQREKNVSIYLRDSPLSYNKEVVLEDERDLEFEVGEINYEKLQLDYFISFSTSNDDFRSLEQTSISFRDLKPGNYTLQIYAENNNYGFKSNLISRQVIVRHRIYETIWFKLGALSLLIFALILATYSRFKVLKKRSEEKIQVEKDYAKIELQALQSQLNPHFVFNCLNSIHALINEGKTDEANEYLTKFSRLLRKFLEQSSTHLTTLAEELEINKIYLELERLRFKEKLDYEIIISPEVEDLNMEIPSVIIQPLVENAIRHGIFHKSDGGKVIISVEKHENQLVIAVKDNGIGIKAAKIINNTDDHESKALVLMQRKKALLNIVEGMNITSTIKEIKQGTEVTIVIPLDESE